MVANKATAAVIMVLLLVAVQMVQAVRIPKGGRMYREDRVLAQQQQQQMSISVSYGGGGGGGQKLKEGQAMRMSETTSPPTLYVDDGGASSSYAVVMLDAQASRTVGSPLLTYVHYWVVVTARGSDQAATITNVVAPYVEPKPHDTLLHPYQFFVFPATPATTSASITFLLDRFTTDFLSLVGNPTPLASTSFTEQLATYP